MMEGPGADSEEKHEPVRDIDAAVVVVGLKALDPEWPIREAIRAIADIAQTSSIDRKWPISTVRDHREFAGVWV